MGDFSDTVGEREMALKCGSLPPDVGDLPGQVLGTPLLFSGSDRVCTKTTSEQPTGHSDLTSKAEEGFKVTSK